MTHCKDTENLHLRIKKIMGQLQAIDRMIDEDKPCEDVIAQINAVKSALHSCGLVVLEGHLRHCVRDGIDDYVGNLLRALCERFKSARRQKRQPRAR